jgi:hypothetical protein
MREVLMANGSLLVSPEDAQELFVLSIALGPLEILNDA